MISSGLKLGLSVTVGIIFLAFFLSKDNSGEVIFDVKKNIEEQKKEIDESFKVDEDFAPSGSLKEQIFSDPEILDAIVQISGAFEDSR